MLRYKTETRPGLVALYDIGQETERVNSYNPGARTGPMKWCVHILKYAHCTNLNATIMLPTRNFMLARNAT